MASYCAVCFSSSLSYLNGLLVCDQCGTQAQGIAEEQDALDAGTRINRHRQQGTGTARTRLLALEAEQQQQDAAQLTPDAELKEIARAYVACLQALLQALAKVKRWWCCQAQVNVLINVFEMPSELLALTRHIWFSFLPYTGMLDYAMDHRNQHMRSVFGVQPVDEIHSTSGQKHEHGALNEAAQHSSEGDSEGSSDEDSDRDATSLHDTEGVMNSVPELKLGRRYKIIGVTEYGSELRVRHHKHTTAEKVLKNARSLSMRLQQTLPHQITLIICYLACYILRQPVMPMDLARWALDGDLPYYDMHQHCRQAVQSMRHPPPEDALRPKGIHRVSYWLLSACEMADMLALKLPAVNAELLLWRLVQGMSLPKAIYHVALELMHMYLADAPNLHLKSLTDFYDPYMMLAALVTTAMRIAYGLDGRKGRALLPHLPPPPPSWQDWAAQHLTHSSLAHSYPLTATEAQELRGLSLQQYLDFCKQHPFSAYEPVPETRELSSTLNRLANLPSRAMDEQQPVAGPQVMPEQSMPSHDDPGRDPAHSPGHDHRMHQWHSATCAHDFPDAVIGPLAQPNQHLDNHSSDAPTVGRPLTIPGADHIYRKLVVSENIPHPDLAAVVAVAASQVNASPESLVALLQRIDKGLQKAEQVLKKSPSQPFPTSETGGKEEMDGGDGGDHGSDSDSGIV